MRLFASALLVVACAVASIAWAQIPSGKAAQLESGDVYRLDTGDVVAIFSGKVQDGSRDCVLHVVQMDGAIHLPFGKVETRGKTIAEFRDSIQSLSEAAEQHGMVDVVATIADLRNSDNDHILRNLR